MELKFNPFERAGELEDVGGDGDDLGADAIAGKQSDGVAFGGCGGGTPDPTRFGGLFGHKHGVEWEIGS